MRRPDPRPPAPRRCTGDAGAVLAEAAFISPILLLLLMAIFEYGVLYRDLLGASDAVESGAQAGATQGPDLAILKDADGNELASVTADYVILRNTRGGLAGISPGMIERIVVFKAQGPKGGTPMEQVPEVCKTSTTSVTGTCNVYLMPRAFQEIERGTPAALSYFQCPNSTVACGWDPQNRDDGPPASKIEYLGVYLKMRRDPVTGIIPVTDNIEVAAIHRLEPGQLQ